MKTKHFIFIFICSSIFSLIACDPIYFTNPQPFDAKNIYEFPKEYRGLWVVEGDSTIIGENYFILKEYKQTIGIAKKEIDTSSTYILKNNKIYIKKKYADINLSEGFSYKLQNDSVLFNSRDIYKVSLSYDTFLRKVDEYYILNTSNTSTWWNLYLIKKTTKNILEVYVLAEDDLQNTKKDAIFISDEGIFLNTKWCKNDLLKFIKNGGFSKKILDLDLKEKKPLPK